MKFQNISDTIPNVIPISRIREDIDSLLGLLERFKEVNVLRGQSILFKAVRVENPEEKQKEIREAVARIRQFREKYAKKRRIAASEWLIRERDRMRTKKYYDGHHH